MGKKKMRTVIIEREKSFVGSAMKVYVYIKSAVGDVSIAFEKYKLVGVVKNNEKMEFVISNADEVIHICYWKSETFYPAICNIESGSKDIKITIKPKFNMFKGHPITITSIEELVTDASVIGA